VATQTIPRRQSRRHAPSNHRRGKPPRHWLLRFWWLWAVPLAGALIVFGALAYVYFNLSLDVNVQQDQTSFLYDKNGRLLTAFEAGVDRTAIDFEDMPKVLLMATLAAEDEDFYRHNGVDLFAIIRAAWANVTGGRIEQGASTITQQYVRNVYPEVGTEVTVTRKIKEVLYAIKLENALSKNEILRRYLNTVYFGQGAYGVEAAAQTYFRTHAKNLDLLQSATLAGIIAGPAYYDPVDHPQAAQARRNFVLGRMVQLGFIELSQAESLADIPVEGVHEPKKGYLGKEEAYYIDWTRRWMEKKYGGETYTGGFRIDGTLDPEWQVAAEEAVAENLSLEPGTPQAGLVAIDVDNGEVRAMFGGKEFAKDQTNLATGDGGTGRQSGSAFKPFTLITAIEQGISLNTTYYGPGQIDLSDEGCPGWAPGNYSDSGFGTMDLASATANSVNTIFAQLVVEVGPENVAQTAHRMGIRSPLEIDGRVPCSITLGTLEVTPLEMTDAFATFASGGIRRPATPVSLIKGPEGDVIEETTREGRRVLDRIDALQAIHAMKEVVCCGTGTAADDGLTFEMFGKTGTTQDDADVWYCGATSEVAACVWVGHKEGRIAMPGATGGTVAAPIWNDFIVKIADDIREASEPFETPEFLGEIVTPSPIPVTEPTAVEEEPVQEEEEPAEEPGGNTGPPSPKPAPPPTTPPPTIPPPTTPPTTPPPEP
jgi:penicillin-binding protein 1A